MTARLALTKDGAVLGKELDVCIVAAPVGGEQLLKAAEDLKESTQRAHSVVEKAAAGAILGDLTALQVSLRDLAPGGMRVFVAKKVAKGSRSMGGC
eukprot:10834275-Lingulodinium_polyedra.AAC.1